MNVSGLIKRLQSLIDEDDDVGNMRVVFFEGQRLNVGALDVIRDAEVLGGEKPVVALRR